MLKSMGINMAVTLPYDFYSLPNVTIDPLITCGYSLLVSESSSLAALESASIDDIRNENIVVQGESLGELTFGRIVVEHMQNNHQLTPAYIVDNLETLMLMVGTNQAVAILPDCMLFSGAYKIKKLKLLNYPEEVSYSIIWRPNISSPGLVSFVEILKEHFRKLQQ
jgi:DNA-binding transcriptional LysR family regulator